VPRPTFRYPIWREFVGPDAVYECSLLIDMRDADGSYRSRLFLFDTGSGFTRPPISEAERLQIPFHRQRPVNVRGTTGTGQGFLAPLGGFAPFWVVSSPFRFKGRVRRRKSLFFNNGRGRNRPISFQTVKKEQSPVPLSAPSERSGCAVRRRGVTRSDNHLVAGQNPFHLSRTAVLQSLLFSKSSAETNAPFRFYRRAAP
jgi:hypothetical protein